MHLLIYIIGICLSVQTIFGKGHVSLELIKYRNPTGKDTSGSCCEGFDCGDLCDPLFKICYRQLPNTARTCPVTSSHFDNTNTVKFGPNIGKIKNPITFQFDTFDTSLSIEIEVLDHDEGWLQGEDDHIETVTHTVRTATQFTAISTPARMVFSGTRVSIEVVLRVRCDDHYYGQGCGVYCRAEDNPHHYVCTRTGKKQCLSQWIGSDCNTWNHCHNITCEHSGTCLNSRTDYTCSCDTHYTGELCESYISTSTLTPVPTRTVTTTTVKTRTTDVTSLLTSTKTSTTCTDVITTTHKTPTTESRILSSTLPERTTLPDSTLISMSTTTTKQPTSVAYYIATPTTTKQPTSVAHFTSTYTPTTTKQPTSVAYFTSTQTTTKQQTVAYYKFTTTTKKQPTSVASDTSDPLSSSTTLLLYPLVPSKGTSTQTHTTTTKAVNYVRTAESFTSSSPAKPSETTTGTLLTTAGAAHLPAYTGSSKSGLSNGAIVGVAVGLILLVLAVLLLILMSCGSKVFPMAYKQRRFESNKHTTTTTFDTEVVFYTKGVIVNSAPVATALNF